MKNKDNYTFIVIKKAYKELIYAIITAIFIRGLLLVIPVFWSNAINNLSEGNFEKTYYTIIIIILLCTFFYIWKYLNQVTWFKFYDKLYMGYTSLITNNKGENIKKTSLAEYTNIINNDIDLLCNFLGNGVARIIQVMEIFFIFFYFLSQNIYIFIVTLIASILMIVLLIVSSNSVKNENMKRKIALDKKTYIAHKMYESIKDEDYEDPIFKKFHQSSTEYLKSNKDYNLLAQAVIYLVLGIIELTKYGIILYSVYLISKGNMEVGTIILIYTYYDKIVTSFEVLGIISAEYQSFLVSLKRLNKLGTNQTEVEG